MSTAWNALSGEIRGCRACAELAATRQQVVVGEAPPGPPRLALVGEAPGAAEDAAGRPFVGRAGRLLDRLLADAGLDRAGVAVLNVIKCRPPGNRAPTAVEVDNCRGYLVRQLDLLDPPLVVALGSTAVNWFLGRRTTLAAVRGKVHRPTLAAGAEPLRVLATYHPSAAIRFGPRGAPMAALREDLAHAAMLAGPASTGEPR